MENIYHANENYEVLCGHYIIQCSTVEYISRICKKKIENKKLLYLKYLHLYNQYTNIDCLIAQTK